MSEIQSPNEQSSGKASSVNRFKLMAAFFIVGAISLVQPGCNCSSSSDGNTTPSAIASVSPASNSSNVLVSTIIEVVFLNDMDSASVINAFSLSLNGAAVTSTVTYNAVTKTAILVPDNDLVSGSQYRAAVDSTVKDSNGDFPLPSGFIWSFSTSSSLQLVSKNSSGVTANEISQFADIDGTGRYIVFESNATNLDAAFTISPGGPSQVYRKDTVTGEVLLVSVGSLGVADNDAGNPSISTNGRYVVFESAATNLDISIDSPGTSQIYLKDMQNGSVDLVSLNAALVPDDSFNTAKNASVSDDGQFVVFESSATNLHAVIPSGGIPQVYRKNTTNANGSVEMISRTALNIAGDGDSTNPDMSADGTHIVFESVATNFSVTNGFKDIYHVNTSVEHAVEKISVSTGTVDANAHSNSPSVSDNGLIIVFHTDATNLDGNDIDGTADVYLRNLATGSTVLVSASLNIPTSGNAPSTNAKISGNAAYVVFESFASDLITGDSTIGIRDIFVRDLSVLPVVDIDRVNNPYTGAEAMFGTNRPVISTDGRYVGFHSEEKYTIDDTDTLRDVFRAYNSTYQ